jgi:hypothetical protein
VRQKRSLQRWDCQTFEYEDDDGEFDDAGFEVEKESSDAVIGVVGDVPLPAATEDGAIDEEHIAESAPSSVAPEAAVPTVPLDTSGLISFNAKPEDADAPVHGAGIDAGLVQNIQGVHANVSLLPLRVSSSLMLVISLKKVGVSSRSSTTAKCRRGSLRRP